MTTPTEAGVAAVIYAVVVGKFVYRELPWARIAVITCESMINSGMILPTIAAAGIFSWLVANLAIGDTLAKTPNAYQIDLVHLGVVVVLNLMIGQPTPPSGGISFLTAQIAGAPLHAVFREALPFTIVLVAVLLLVPFVPQLALWLPDVLLPRRGVWFSVDVSKTHCYDVL